MIGPRCRQNPSSLERRVPGLRSISADVPMGLWLLDHTAPFDPELFSWLSAKETHRAGCFRFAEHRRRYLAAHAVLRGLIADRTGVPPSALRFGVGNQGEPFLPWKGAPMFSLSYSPGLCLLGIADDQPIGVDIEQNRIIPDAEELANFYFTPEERRMLGRSQGDRSRSLTFLHGWTRKESCLKAVGMGLSYPAWLLETHLSRPRTQVAMQGMRAETASMMMDGHVIAWARILPSDAPVIAERAFQSG